MKTKIDLPPDFGEFYERNFGKDFGFAGEGILISNFTQIDSIAYLSFCDYYWGNEHFMLLLYFDIMKSGGLLKFKGNNKFREWLKEKLYFKNEGIVTSDFDDAPIETFLETPIQVMVEAVPGKVNYAYFDRTFRAFEVTRFSFPKVLNLKKLMKKNSKDKGN